MSHPSIPFSSFSQASGTLSPMYGCFMVTFTRSSLSLDTPLPSVELTVKKLVMFGKRDLRDSAGNSGLVI